jgi:DNA-binding transcriptional ArsR family regulator
MVKRIPADLDLVFAALSDSRRRGVLAQLGGGSFTISELAQPHAMSLPGFMKHLALLEAAGLIARSKEGRVVRCELAAAPMREAALWLAGYERFWTDRLDALGLHLNPPKESNPWTQAPTRNRPRSSSAAATAPPPKPSGKRGPTRKR